MAYQVLAIVEERDRKVGRATREGDAVSELICLRQIYCVFDGEVVNR